MQSPSRPESGAELRQAMLESEAQRRAQDIHHEIVVREMDLKSANVANALSAAGETLRRQEEALQAVNRELAHMTADRTRQLQSREEKLQALENELRGQGDELLEGENSVQWSRDQLANVRRTLSQMQLNIEDLQQEAAAKSLQISELQRKNDGAKSTFEQLQAVQDSERRELESRAGELNTALKGTQEEHRRLVNLFPPKEHAHKERAAFQNRRLEEIRHDLDEKRTLLSSIRQQVEEHDLQMEEANRRRRKHQDEMTKELVADRKAALQQLQSERDKRERQIKADTEARLDEHRGRYEALTALLPTERIQEEKAFERELELHDQIQCANEATVGVDVLQQRISSTEDHINSLLLQIKNDQDACQTARTTLTDRDRQIASFRDAVAPLPDVEASCAKLLDRERQTLQDRTEGDAEHALWRARNSEAQQALNDSTAATNEESHRLKNDVEELRLRTKDEVRTIEAQIQVQDSELVALHSKLEDMNARNRALDVTLEHVARQRRSMLEEMAHRREQARLAAAALVAQLE